MAMKKCRECKAEVSSAAPVCPHCGVKNPGRPGGLSVGAIGCLGLIGLVVLFAVIGQVGSNESNSPPSASEVAQTRAQQDHLRQVANSIAVATPLSKIASLSEGQLRTVVEWSDKTKYAQNVAGARRE